MCNCKDKRVKNLRNEISQLKDMIKALEDRIDSHTLFHPQGPYTYTTSPHIWPYSISPYTVTCGGTTYEGTYHGS